LNIVPILTDIGHGAAGARSLDCARACACVAMGAVLDGQVDGPALGAFVMALRMSSNQPLVPISVYKGLRRPPNLTPLLALELSRAGARVLVHGPALDPARVTSAQIFHDLGLPRALHQSDVHAAWARREPAFMTTDMLCPPLQALLDLRWTLGLRNIGHGIAKMLHPLGAARCLQLVNTTHPEFGALVAHWARQEGADAMLLRGTEGEPVADPRRQPRIDNYIGGHLHDPACLPAQDGVFAELPLLPRDNDAATTALYIQSVLGGETPAPEPLIRQVQAVLAALSVLEDVPQARRGRTH